MTQNEAISKAIEAYDNCKDGTWIGAKPYNISMLFNLATCSIEHASKGDWKSARHWANRCVEMEKKIGFEDAPIWGEFGNTVETIYNGIE